MKHDEDVNDTALRQLAQRLGTRAAERLDVELTAQAVVTRLRHQPPVTAWVRLSSPPGWLRLAAAVVLLVGAGLIVRGGFPRGPRSAGLIEPAGAELTDLSTAQLRELLQTVGRPSGDQDMERSQDVGLEDLSAPQLRALLESLEG